MTVIPDWTVSLQILNFLVLIFFLNLVLYKPIRGILQKRREKMEGLEKDINGALKGADAKAESLEKGLADARSRGLKNRDEITEKGILEQKEIISDINEKAARELEEMRKKIAADILDAEASLKKEIPAFARAISEKMLGRAI